MKWWEYYLFENEEQYLKWKAWSLDLLTKQGLEKKFNTLDMVYGLNYKLPEIKKEGQMVLF